MHHVEFTTQNVILPAFFSLRLYVYHEQSTLWINSVQKYKKGKLGRIDKKVMRITMDGKTDTNNIYCNLATSSYRS